MAKRKFPGESTDSSGPPSYLFPGQLSSHFLTSAPPALFLADFQARHGLQARLEGAKEISQFIKLFGVSGNFIADKLIEKLSDRMMKSFGLLSERRQRRLLASVFPFFAVEPVQKVVISIMENLLDRGCLSSLDPYFDSLAASPSFVDFLSSRLVKVFLARRPDLWPGRLEVFIKEFQQENAEFGWTVDFLRPLEFSRSGAVRALGRSPALENFLGLIEENKEIQEKAREITKGKPQDPAMNALRLGLCGRFPDDLARPLFDDLGLGQAEFSQAQPARLLSLIQSLAENPSGPPFLSAPVVLFAVSHVIFSCLSSLIENEEIPSESADLRQAAGALSAALGKNGEVQEKVFTVFFPVIVELLLLSMIEDSEVVDYQILKEVRTAEFLDENPLTRLLLLRFLIQSIDKGDRPRVVILQQLCLEIHSFDDPLARLFLENFLFQAREKKILQAAVEEFLEPLAQRSAWAHLRILDFLLSFDLSSDSEFSFVSSSLERLEAAGQRSPPLE